ncbi:protein FAM91A1-like isoform X1 [Chenopodium quinoa]|uniref:protein FAM91A1-like isoform X1 n=2 Tax=Chenopodium quinoa TaxID=63459 RepID=UPI000B76C2BA|nr:protein FAM91A1-like isoform X1 [Chenopodium quinoa]XP_021743593.1 protein FAM91A1-like isoform X1 [Chenopodium quinoa]
MLRAPATVEEQLILKAIREECPWENLPKRLQSTLSSKEEWHRRVIEHCIKKRLQWSTCFARKVIKESEYYEEMMRYLRRNLALFPYHLSEYVCRVMRVSPFRYYCDIIFEVMKSEQPYDSIPNFSAADALRITGIGRNEFIDIMNKCRSKKFMWKINKSIAKELLPTQPADFPIEPWWGVCLVNFTLEEFKKLSDEEMAMIDKVCKEEANSYVLFNPDIIKGLYRRGLIYFDVPVYSDDRFKVSRLEGFVSNREQSYEDPIEELLYAVFVVSSENATVAELASTLQADLLQLQSAASFACRLGWAEKIIDPASILQDANVQGSLILSDDEDGSRASVGSANLSVDGVSVQQDYSGSESRAASNQARVAFIVDANITSYLMMGSVSPGLKSHAVTLYEAGKLGHASIADLCKDLSTLEGTKFEGELQEFANHASSLRCVLECLLSGGVSDSVGDTEIGHKVDTVSSQSSDTSTAVETSLTHNASGLNGDKFINIESQDKIIDSECLERDSPSYSISGASSADTKLVSEDHIDDSYEQRMLDPISEDNEISALESDAPRRKRSYRLDLLRCESLATLAPATLDRLFHRDYDIVLSMVPLPPASILPGQTGPVHFGPPSHSSMTPWMKLVLYSAVGSGPLSVVLMKGQYLRLLPAPLAGCEKALIWSWDGSTIGGVGGKFEGSLVKGTVLLHCLNSLLRHSAVLVQPLSKYDLDKSGKIVTIDVPLPLKNSDGSLVHVGEELGLGIDESTRLESLISEIVDRIDLWTIGYIRLLRLFIETDADQLSPDDERYEWVPLSVEFGVPLFSPKLCKKMCKRVISSQLLQTESFDEHHEAMHGLRRRLRDVCAEYSPTGPAAKLLYQKEKPKDKSRQLMTYASGRWNPLAEPSSPIAGATEYQRKKLSSRQRSRREVLSFDGSILRSYALSPVYEAATRPIEESNSTNVPKVESDDADSKDVILPGVSLLFDGAELEPFEIGACLQARQPIALIAEASSATSALAAK